MPTIRLKTRVSGSYQEVFSRFDRDLFEALKPIGMQLEIVTFDGSKVGDRVHLRFGSPINTDWISDIIEEGGDEDHLYFIDKGIKLPWPLKSWSHKHIVAQDGINSCFIIDEMTYDTGNFAFSALIKPFLFASFLPRKRQYQRYFGSVG